MLHMMEFPIDKSVSISLFPSDLVKIALKYVMLYIRTEEKYLFFFGWHFFNAVGSKSNAQKYHKISINSKIRAENTIATKTLFSWKIF